MSLILSYLRRYRKLLGFSILLATINQVFSLVNPQIFRILIDQYANNIDAYTESAFIAGIIKRSLIAVGAALISRTAKTFQDYYVNLMSQTIGSKIYAQGVGHAFSLPYRVFEDRQSGSLLDKLLKARTDIQNLLNNAINNVFLTAVGIVIVVVYGFYVHWLIGALFLLLPPILIVTSLMISRRIKNAQTAIVRQSSELSGSTVENIKNVTLIKSLGLESQEIDHLTQTNNKLINLEIDKLKLIKTLSFSQGTLINLLRTVLQGVMLWMVFTGDVTVWEFFSLLFYSFLLFNPMYLLPDVVKNRQETRASSQTLQDILNLPQETHTDTGHEITQIQSLRFDDVTFSYEQDIAVEHIDFSLTPGQTIAFVWPSGAGKSTILKLITWLYQPQSWYIHINNHDSYAIARTSVKQRLGVVAQETQLFTWSVRNNLLFVAPDATDEQCWRVLEQAQLAETILTHDAGLDAPIGEWWFKLSGGQKQRLAIARALLRQPDILIFDEATSALDSLIEAQITDTIKDITTQNQQLMTILVAHRLSTIMHADMIYVLEAGRIIESGSHDQLLDHRWLYAALWRQQVGTT